MLSTRTFPKWLGYLYITDGTAWVIATIQLFILSQALPPTLNALGFIAFLTSLILSSVILFGKSIFMWAHWRAERQLISN